MNTPISLTGLKVVVDNTLPNGELHIHQAMFDLLKMAFLDADMRRSLALLDVGKVPS